MNLVKSLLLSLGVLATMALPLSVSASERALQQFFERVEWMQARFTQQVVDEGGMTLDRSSGQFYLSRPGKFRWNYFAPGESHSEAGAATEGQQIIADGQFIYMYDPDLAQVTRRSMQDALSQVPSLVLVQSGNQLQDHFDITDFGLTDGLSWVSLKPKAEEAGYQQLMIGFAGDELRSIVLFDGLGNETRLQLSQIDASSQLPASRFNFTAPDGVDMLIE